MIYIKGHSTKCGNSNMFPVMGKKKATNCFRHLEKIRGHSSQSTTGMLPMVDEVLKALNVDSLSYVTDILDSFHFWQLGLQPLVKELKY